MPLATGRGGDSGYGAMNEQVRRALETEHLVHSCPIRACSFTQGTRQIETHVNDNIFLDLLKCYVEFKRLILNILDKYSNF